jgi:hypothetical protein
MGSASLDVCESKQLRLLVRQIEDFAISRADLLNGIFSIGQRKKPTWLKALQKC